MRIVDAFPAPTYVRIPIQALEALDTDRLGKGEIITLARIARYLRGRQRPLEGSTSDFCTILGIDERTWQRHLPQLGQTGTLDWSQPHRGYWILHDLAFAWDRPVRDRLQEATKLSAPVVVNNSDLEIIFSPSKQQQQSLGEEGRDEPTKMSLDPTKLSDQGRNAYRALQTLGIKPDQVALQLAHHFDPEYILDVVEIVKRRGRSVSNPAGFAIRAITGEWTLPELQSKWFPELQDDDDPARFIQGEYAHLIQR